MILNGHGYSTTVDMAFKKFRALIPLNPTIKKFLDLDRILWGGGGGGGGANPHTCILHRVTLISRKRVSDTLDPPTNIRPAKYVKKTAHCSNDDEESDDRHDEISRCFKGKEIISIKSHTSSALMYTFIAIMLYWTTTTIMALCNYY